MRITNSMMIDNMLRNLNNGLGRVNTYHNQLASNRRIVKLSDDPIGVLNSMGARQQIRRLEQYQRNVDTSRAWVQQTESAVTEMEQAIISAKELLTDAMGTENKDDKKIFATQIRQITETILELGNSSMGDKYIFGGFNVTNKPFTAERDATGKIVSVQYNGLDLTGMGVSFDTLDGNKPKFDTPEDVGVKDLNWNGQLKNVSGTFSVTTGTTTDADGNEIPALIFTDKNDPSITYEAYLDGFPADVDKVEDGETITAKLVTKDGEEFGTVTWKADKSEGKEAMTVGSILDALAEPMTTATISSGNVKNEQIASGPTTPAGLVWSGTLEDTSQKYTIEQEGSVLTFRNAFGTVAGTVDLNTAATVVATDEYGVEQFTAELIDPHTGMNFGTVTYTRDATTESEVQFPLGMTDPKEQAAYLIAQSGFVTTRLGEESTQRIQFEIGYNMNIDVTFTGIDLVGTGEDNLFNVMINLANDLDKGLPNEDLTHYLTKLTTQQDRLLTSVMKCGNRTTKLDTMVNRYSLDAINYEATRSNIEDIDQAKVITQMKYAEMIYKQALASGAQIIQPTLMDFLR